MSNKVELNEYVNNLIDLYLISKKLELEIYELEEDGLGVSLSLTFRLCEVTDMFDQYRLEFEELYNKIYKN